MVGRTRKKGERFSCGKLKRNKEYTDTPTPEFLVKVMTSLGSRFSNIRIVYDNLYKNIDDNRKSGKNINIYDAAIASGMFNNILVHMRDPKAMSILGRMNLRGIISDIQYNAALRYREKLQTYSSMKGLPYPYPYSQGMPSGCNKQDLDEEKYIKVKQDIARVELEMTRLPRGLKTIYLLRNLCLHDILPPENDYIIMIRRGLDVIDKNL